VSFLENLVVAWVTVFALLLLVVAALAYRRSANPKIAGVMAAFALMFVKGLGMTWFLFTTTESNPAFLFIGIVDALVLLAFYLSALRP